MHYLYFEKSNLRQKDLMVLRPIGKMSKEQTKLIPIIVVQMLWIINFIPMSEILKCEKVRILASSKYNVVSNPQNISAKEVSYPLTLLRCCPCKIVIIVINMIILPNNYWAVNLCQEWFAWIYPLHGSHLSIIVVSCEITTTPSPFCWWRN